VKTQVLVYPQGIEGGGIKAGKEHIDNKQQVHFPVFHTLGDILIVVLKILA